MQVSIEKLTLWAVFVVAVLHAIGHLAAVAAKTFPGGRFAAFALKLTSKVQIAEGAIVSVVPAAKVIDADASSAPTVKP